MTKFILKFIFNGKIFLIKNRQIGTVFILSFCKVQRTFRLLKHEISSFFRFLKAISTCLNTDPDSQSGSGPLSQLNPDQEHTLMLLYRTVGFGFSQVLGSDSKSGVAKSGKGKRPEKD
jgi:hypothetical protein